MAGWIANLVYAALIVSVSPLLIVRSIRQGKYRAGWRQKLLGDVPIRTGSQRCVWFHAVSVGEVLLLRQVIARLTRQSPDVEIWISTTTTTGQAVAREKFPEHRVIYFPLDFTWAVRRAIQRVRPDMVALVELELWPNFIAGAERAGVPLVLLNGRMSERSHKGYLRIRWLVARWLCRFSVITAQTQADADRLRSLGAPTDRLIVTGSVKYDGLEFDRNNPRTCELREAFGIGQDELVFMAGSTQAPEEEIALNCYEKLRSLFPNLRLILVPRHQERFAEVAALIEQRHHAILKRSTTKTPLSRDQRERATILLLDTLGELSACWGLADVAFVGGSLSRRGGQNMLEPAAYGAAVLFAPNTFNFRHAVELLLSQEAAIVIRSEEDLTTAAERLLRDASRRHGFGHRARETVLSQQGATDRSVELLSRLLDHGGIEAARHAA